MLLLPVYILLSLLLSATHMQEDAYKAQREQMVEQQLKRRGIRDQAVLTAMRTVKRHLFVPPSIAAEAYSDGALPIGLKQTISQPYMVTYMTEVIRPTPDMNVLEIGTGSGYQAAVLAEIVKQVYTIEIIPEHGKAAAARLRQLGYENVEVKIGDGYAGWEEHAPFDAIIVTAGAESVPPPLFAQLKEGGRMVIPVGPVHSTQTLKLIEKKAAKL